MVKKTPLKLVTSPPTDPSAPPAELGKAGRKLWTSIMSEYNIEDGGGREMLLQVCAASDWLAEYGAAIDRDGPVVRTKSGSREHPLLKAELATRSFITRTLARLGLDVEPIKSVGRPAGKFGWTGDVD